MPFLCDSLGFSSTRAKSFNLICLELDGWSLARHELNSKVPHNMDICFLICTSLL